MVYLQVEFSNTWGETSWDNSQKVDGDHLIHSMRFTVPCFSR